MIVSRIYTQLGEEILGLELNTCPHCKREESLEVRYLEASLLFFDLPTGRALVCPRCRGASRLEGLFSRALNALFLVPFALLLLAAAGGGGWILASGILEGGLSAGFAAIGLGLLGVGGYLAWRVLRSVRILVFGRELVPLSQQFQTSL